MCAAKMLSIHIAMHMYTHIYIIDLHSPPNSTLTAIILSVAQSWSYITITLVSPSLPHIHSLAIDSTSTKVHLLTSMHEPFTLLSKSSTDLCQQEPITHKEPELINLIHVTLHSIISHKVKVPLTLCRIHLKAY